MSKSKFKVGQEVIVTSDLKALNAMGVYSGFAGQKVEIVRDRFADAHSLFHHWVRIKNVSGSLTWIDPAYLSVAKVKTAKPSTAKVKAVKPSKVKVKTAKHHTPSILALARAVGLYPQTRKVLSHIETKGSITPLEAFGVYRITRLAARINELRNAGLEVKTTMKMDATGTRYASYSF